MSKLKTSTNELDTTKSPKMNGYHNDLNNNTEMLNGGGGGGHTKLTNGLYADEELQRLVLNQLEFYFSRENLLHDKYLLSQMDNDNYVPISILINFNMIKKLFSNSSLLQAQDDERIKFVQNLIKSQNSQLQLDTTQLKLRANHKRCVIILREIDKDTPIENIKIIFDKCKVKCLNCEFAGSRSWYLTFKDEQEAQIAVQFVKEEVQFFNNEPLFARIKTNPIPRVNSVNSNSKADDSSLDKSENESETKPIINYPQYPFYYPNFDINQMPLLANPWMIYPSPPTTSTTNYPNFSKIKNNQTSTDSNSSNNNLSSSSSVSNVSNYVLNPIDPFMIPYGAYPHYKQQNFYRKNFNKKIETDPNSSQNEENDEEKRYQKNHRYNNNNNSNYNLNTYNHQNFIIFPTAPFVAYPPHIPYNLGVFPHFAQPVSQPINQASSSSSSTSSKPPAQTDLNGTQKQNYQKTAKFNNINNNKKYTAPQTSKQAHNSTDNNSDNKKFVNQSSTNSNTNKYPTKNNQSKSGFKKNPRSSYGSNRKMESMQTVQFDYEPTSFPPLNDKPDETKSPEIEPEILDEDTESDSSPWSANSRKSFAEIVKDKKLANLAEDLNKVKLTEE